MFVGYMRVSSDSDRQTTALQRDALLAAGVDERHLFEDHASGAKDDRPGLISALAFLRSGDVLVVWKLDRLVRSLSHLLTIVNAVPEFDLMRTLRASSFDVGATRSIFQSGSCQYTSLWCSGSKRLPSSISLIPAVSMCFTLESPALRFLTEFWQ
jgi:hypothetical protein